MISTIPVQIAYFVADVEQAALEMNRVHGAGPFYLAREIQLAAAVHRGQPCPFVHSSAYGQWGQIMMELVQQDVEGPSPFRDLFGPGQSGLHHLAFFVDELDVAITHYQNRGLTLATRAMTATGVEFVFIDGIEQLGHMLELYEPDPALEGFYEFIRRAAAGWDGSRPLRTL